MSEEKHMAMEKLSKRDRSELSKLQELALPGARITDVERLGGLTNRSFHVFTDQGEFVFRLPGEGTENLIDRHDERLSTFLASDLGIDTEIVYFNATTGLKVSRYLDQAVTMNATTLRDPENIILVAEILRKLHDSGQDTGIVFDILDMAMHYEKIIQDGGLYFFDRYEDVRALVIDHLEKGPDRPKVTCHNDPLCENWIKSGDRMYLVDWEYAGMNAASWDLADVSIEAAYGNDEDQLLLTAYYEGSMTEEEFADFALNKIYIDFLWSLWGRARQVYEGEPMRIYADYRYNRLLKNISAVRFLS